MNGSFVLLIIIVAIAGGFVWRAKKRRSGVMYSDTFTQETPMLDAAIQRAISIDDFSFPGQFVIFEGINELTYVQFTIRPKGLLCFWSKGVPEIDGVKPRLRKFLKSGRFVRVKTEKHGPQECLEAMGPGKFVVCDQGFYIQVGREFQSVKAFVIGVFNDVFGNFDESDLSVTIDKHKHAQ